MSARVAVRAAKEDELPYLAELELRAARRFAESPHAYACQLPSFDPVVLRELQVTGTVWVACDEGDRVLGFAIGGWLDREPYLHELDVDLPYQGRGIGRSLIRRVAEWAHSQQRESLLLSTFHDVPWNAPYYARIGFAVVPLEAYSPAMQLQRQHDERAGMRVESRVMMRARIARLLSR